MKPELRFHPLNYIDQSGMKLTYFQPSSKHKNAFDARKTFISYLFPWTIEQQMPFRAIDMTFHYFSLNFLRAHKPEMYQRVTLVVLIKRKM